MARTIQAIYKNGIFTPLEQHLSIEEGTNVALIVFEPRKEIPLEGYEHLAWLPNSWRKQPYLKGRTLTVGQLVRSMRADRLECEAASERYSLPIEAIQEANRYFDQHRELIEQEADKEKRSLIEKGYRLEP